MNGEQLYFTLSQMNIGDKKVFMATLTENQKLLYKRHLGKMRQQRFNENPLNKEKLNEHRKDYIAEKRKENPLLFQEKNIRDVQAFRQREKAKLKAINDKQKANEILTNVIKTRKAKKELILLKDAKQKQENINIVKDVLFNIIDNIPKEDLRKKKREYMRKYRAKKKLKLMLKI